MSSAQDGVQAGEISDPFKTVQVETTLGVIYEFPDMLAEHLGVLSRQDAEGVTTLALLNASDCCLMVPWRIIQKISVDGKVTWERP